MSNIKLNLLILFVIFNIPVAFSQDLVRVGAAFNFKKEKVFQTFSFDLNRTEKVDEKVGKYIYFSKRFYLQPSTDINIGDGVTSSENNILFQANMGRIHTGKKKSKNRTVRALNYSSEVNPSYNSDKEFSEKLYFMQIKRVWNFLSQTLQDSTPDIKMVNSFAIGPYMNIGSRDSRKYDKDHLYNTAGVVLEYKFRSLSLKHKEKLTASVSGSYGYIISDLSEVAKDKFSGILKASVNRQLYKAVLLGLSIKYGNENPTYQYVSTLDISLKFKY